MTDYTGEGAAPVEDAAVADPPTVDEVLERQRELHEQPDDDRAVPDVEDEGIAGLVNNTGLDGDAASG